MQTSNKHLFVVDASSLLFRAFYAIPPLNSPEGLPVNALYGFLNMIFKLEKDFKPDQMIFCYDSKEKGERYRIYPEYKANRGSMPEDLALQIPLIKNSVELLGYPSLESSGVEADDLIGSLCELAKKKYERVTIISGDKDFAQLIDNQVQMYDSMKNITYDFSTAQKKWEIPPHQMIDYLALVGDSSDNIPGAKGIGPKSAIRLLTEFNSIDEVYQNLDKIDSSLKNKLIQSKEMVYLSKDLVTIRTSINLDSNIFNHQKYEFQNSHLFLEFLDKFQLRTLKISFNEIYLTRKSGATSKDNLSIASEVLTNHNQSASNLEQVLPNQNQISSYTTFDKTSDLDALNIFKPHATLLLFSYKDRFLFSSLNANLNLSLNQTPSLSEWVAYQGSPSEFLQWLIGHSFLIVTHSSKDIYHQVKSDQIKVIFDFSLSSYILNPSAPHDLKTLCLATAFDKNPENIDFSKLEVDQLVIAFALSIYIKLNQQVNSFNWLLYEIEIPLARILFNMESAGIKIDRSWLIEESQIYSEQLKTLEKLIYDQAGEPFNVASPKQVGHILFEKLKLRAIKKTKTGYSTDNEVLEELKGDHPIISHLLEYRELSKLKSTYLDPLPLFADPNDRIHTTFQQTATATGRLSSQNPNLQNIPIRTPRGVRLRQAFIADSNCLLGSFDYSQIELRILAHMSNDPGLLSAFGNNEDVHAITASQIFNKSLELVTPEDRRMAKAVNFGIAYGQGAFGLSQTLSIPRKQAQEIIEQYFIRFPYVKNYISSSIETAKNQGYVETIFGRRRYLPDLNSKNPMMQKIAQRAAINAPIQGTAADIVKKAMIDISNNSQITSQILLQIHDELIIEGPIDILKQEAPLISEIMQNTFKLKVPLIVNFGLAKNWQLAHS